MVIMEEIFRHKLLVDTVEVTVYMSILLSRLLMRSLLKKQDLYFVLELQCMILLSIGELVQAIRVLELLESVV